MLSQMAKTELESPSKLWKGHAAKTEVEMKYVR